MTSKIPIEKQLTGISGEFFVAAELAKRNFQVALTLGNAKGIDLFATNQVTGITFEIEVKTLRKKPNCFTLLTTRLNEEKIYAFVYLNEVNVYPDFFIIKGSEILKDLQHFYGSSLISNRPTINHGPIQKYKNQWTVIENGN
jgi:hypothetical protein